MRRIVEIDSLRGLAALSILFYHMHPEMAVPCSRVDLFLVLSGYLLTSVMQRRVRSLRDLPGLYLRRALRIWPAYFLAMAMVILLNPLLNRPFPLEGLSYHLVFLQNIPYYWGEVPPQFSSYFFHTWTLAIIEQFYLFWPLLLIGLGPRKILPAGLILAVICLMTRTSGLNQWVLLSRCDGLILGGLLAIVFANPALRPRESRAVRWSLILATVLGLLSIGCGKWMGDDISYGDPMTPPGLSLTILGSVLISVGLIGTVVAWSGHWVLAPLRHPWLVRLGAISYSIYLFHPMTIVAVGRACRSAGITAHPWIDLIQIAGCLGVAFTSYHLIETPIISTFRNRFTPARTTGSQQEFANRESITKTASQSEASFSGHIGRFARS